MRRSIPLELRMMLQQLETDLLKRLPELTRDETADYVREKIGAAREWLIEAAEYHWESDESDGDYGDGSQAQNS